MQSPTARGRCNHLIDIVDSDQKVVNKELSLGGGCAQAGGVSLGGRGLGFRVGWARSRESRDSWPRKLLHEGFINPAGVGPGELQGVVRGDVVRFVERHKPM